MFKICIEETVSDKFDIEAKDAEEAMKIAEDKYHQGEIVLEPGDLVAKQMAVIKPESEATDWVEF